MAPESFCVHSPSGLVVFDASLMTGVVPSSSCGFPAADLEPATSRSSASFQCNTLFRDHSLNAKGACKYSS